MSYEGLYCENTDFSVYQGTAAPPSLPSPPPPNKKRERMNRAPEQTQNTVLIPQAEGGLADPSTTPAGSRSLHWIWIGCVCVKILRHCLQ